MTLLRCCRYVTALPGCMWAWVNRASRYHLKGVFDALNPIKWSWKGLVLIWSIGDWTGIWCKAICARQELSCQVWLTVSGHSQIVSMLPKGTDFPNGGHHHHQHHHNRQHHRHYHHQCHRGAVWGKSLIKSDLVRPRSSSSITIDSCIFSQLHLFGGVGTALSFLHPDRWLIQTMSKCVQRWSLETTEDA